MVRGALAPAPGSEIGAALIEISHNIGWVDIANVRHAKLVSQFGDKLSAATLILFLS
jgi:hypothetical protein